MSWLRMAGAISLVGCGWCMGDAVCLQIKAHLDALRQTIALLQEIEQEIAFRRADLNILAQKLCREKKLVCAASAIQTALPPPDFSKQEATCFTECFSGLGQAEAGQECTRLAFYQEQFRFFLHQQEEASQSQCQLARKLGTALGLAVAILLF